MTQDDRRVAITGIGIVSALGANREETWRGLVEGRCGIRRVTLFDTAGYRSHIAAELATTTFLSVPRGPTPGASGLKAPLSVPRGPTPGASGLKAPFERFTPHERRRLSRSDQIALLAAGEAIEDARLETLVDRALPRERVGVILGAGTADLLRNEEYYAELLARGLRRASPRKIFNHFSSTPADVVASRWELTGVKACLAAACSSSTIAIGHAADLIREGKLDAALAGGSDALCRLTMSGFDGLRLVDTEPCRPFDASRKGMNIGEAGAILVLEELGAARRRGAHVYAELAGYGIACEAFHPTSPEPEGRAVAATLRAALASAHADAGDVDHVSTHGTGTVHNDKAEARGMVAVLGERLRKIPVNGIKSMVGHCLGAAGGIEAAAVALTIDRGVIPPTIHHETTDPDCPLDVVPNEAREARVACALSTSLAFGGNNAALVMRRFQS